MDQRGSEGPEKRFKDKSEPIMVERRMRMQEGGWEAKDENGQSREGLEGQARNLAPRKEPPRGPGRKPGGQWANLREAMEMSRSQEASRRVRVIRGQKRVRGGKSHGSSCKKDSSLPDLPRMPGLHG